jgi:hypothetical protein
MVFLSNTTPSGVTYTPDQQRALLNEYIENDKYLRKNRGKYAERNGARTPFSHVIDLKVQQDFNIKIGKKTYQIQLSYDVFNFTNMLNKDWGRLYFMANDQYTLLDMSSFVSATNLTPQYRYTPPLTGKPWILSDGVYSAARWTSQLGVRLSF